MIFNWLYKPCVSSTMDEGWSWINNCDLLPIWIICGAQTNGRGRYGRQWLSQKGNFLSSYINRFTYQKEKFLISEIMGPLSLIYSLAIRNTLQEFCSKPIMTKWPNDVFIEDKKVAGVLLECDAKQDVINSVVGIGVNLQWAPKENTNWPATSLKDHGGDCDVFVFLYRLEHHKNLLINYWNEGLWQELKSQWLSHALGYKKNIYVKKPDGNIIQGVFKDLNENGEVILTQQTGDIIIHWRDMIENNHIH